MNIMSQVETIGRKTLSIIGRLLAIPFVIFGIFLRIMAGLLAIPFLLVAIIFIISGLPVAFLLYKLVEKKARSWK